MAGALLDRALDVVELLVDHPEGVPLSEIARWLNIPKSATHRILSHLGRRGYVGQPEGLERYRLNLKLAALGLRFVSRTNVFDICQPVIDRVAQDTGEFVRLAVWDGAALTWVAKAQGAPHGLRYDPDMGHPVVLHATATGRAWLGTLPEGEAVRLVRERGFDVPERFPKQHIKDESALLSELRLTRKRGYGLAIDEGEPGMAAVAVAIETRESYRSPGTLSVAGPIVRMQPERLKEIVPLVQKATHELGELWPLTRMRQGTPLELTSPVPKSKKSAASKKVKSSSRR
jgi:IclR family transcriptional regulator, acetate operon repressor